MRQNSSAARRWAPCARPLSVIAALAAVMSFAAGFAAQAHAAPDSLTRLMPIKINHSNWSASAGFDSRGPAWYKDSFGLIHLQGAVQQISNAGAGAIVIGTLPRAARPAKFVFTIAHTFNGTFAGLEVAPDGKIIVLPPSFPAVHDSTFVSLEGVVYRLTGRGNPIKINSKNWIIDSCCRHLTWFADSSGVVHLQGAVTQISGGPNANLIGTLPPAARPARNLFTIVQIFGGNYADLAIETTGQIALIDPRPPAAKDYSAVSLESITYRRSLHAGVLTLNSQSWTSKAGFDSRRPGWYLDKDGIVHLQGAVHQTSTINKGANLIGMLPAAAAPRATVYVIVHTFDGTFADLAIAPSGQLALITARPPLVSDYTFVSLESIAYRR